jgi:uncharacterized membrane protein YfcA
MQGLGLPESAVCLAAITFAFAVRGATGFGASTVAIPLMAFVLPISLTVPLISCLIVVSAAPQALRDHERIAWREILKTLPFSLVGVVLGLLVFSHSGDEFLLRSLGAVIAVYGLIGLAGKGRVFQVAPRWRTGAAALAGLSGGALGAVYGAGSAPIYGIYLNSINLEQSVFRATVSAIMLVPIGARVLGYGGLGYYSAEVFAALAVSLPFMFVGSRLGDRWLRGLDKAQFGKLVSAVLLLSGLGLMLK